MRPDLFPPRDPSPPATSRGLARVRTVLTPLAVLAAMLVVGVPAWRADAPDASLPDLSVLPDLATVASATGSPASLAANSALQTSVTPLAIQAGLGASRRCRRDATKLSL